LAKLRDFVKNEPVLEIPFVCVLASCFLVPPDEGYAGYIDLCTLALLALLLVFAELIMQRNMQISGSQK